MDAVMEDAPRAGAATFLESRLAGFDDDDLAGRADRLLEVLAGLQYSRLSVAERYKSLRLCLGFASRLRARLSRQLTPPSESVPVEQIRLSRRCAGAYRLMSDCFRTIAEDIAAQESGPLSDANRLSHACYWGITCLGEYLVIRCECYLKAGAGIWLDIHKLHDLAASEGVDRLPLGRKPEQLRTVDGAYKKLLLLGLSDPFQQPFRSLGRLYDKLDQWAPLTYLTSTSRPSTRCLFVVDPRLDRPASPALSQADLRPELNQRWLVTKGLVTRLKQEYDAAVNRSDGPMTRRGPDVVELDSVEFLRRMIVRWGIHPVRIDTRRRTARSCDLVAGLKTVCIALNRFTPLNLHAVESETKHSGKMFGTVDDDRGGHVDDARILSGWEIEDESDNGVKLVCRRPESCGVEVDDVVAVRPAQARHWSVGIVHWVQADDSGDLSLGLRLVKHSVRPVMIDALRAGPDVARSEALLFADKSDEGMRRFLICPPSVYFPDGAYLVRRPGGRGEFGIQAADMLLASRSFVWFEVVKPRRDTAQKVLELIQPR